MNLYRLEMEGDWDQENYVFTSVAKARDWAKRSYITQTAFDPEAQPFSEFWADYCATSPLTLDP